MRRFAATLGYDVKPRCGYVVVTETEDGGFGGSSLTLRGFDRVLPWEMLACFLCWIFESEMVSMVFDGRSVGRRWWCAMTEKRCEIVSRETICFLDDRTTSKPAIGLAKCFGQVVGHLGVLLAAGKQIDKMSSEACEKEGSEAPSLTANTHR